MSVVRIDDRRAPREETRATTRLAPGNAACTRAGRMRSLLVPLLVLLASPDVRAEEDAPPLMAVELRLGGALSGVIDAGWRPPPVSVGIGVEGALLAEPWTSFYGQIAVDTLRGTDLAVAAGVRVRPGGPLRIGVGAAGIIVPSTAFGPRASVGGCFGHTMTHLCADLEGTAYVAGSALPSGTVAADVRIVIAIAFHLL